MNSETYNRTQLAGITQLTDNATRRMVELAAHAKDAGHGDVERAESLLKEASDWAEAFLEDKEEPDLESVVGQAAYHRAVLAVTGMTVLDQRYQDRIRAGIDLLSFGLDQCNCYPTEIKVPVEVFDEAMSLWQEPITYGDEADYAHQLAEDTEAMGNDVCQHLRDGSTTPELPDLGEMIAQAMSEMGDIDANEFVSLYEANEKDDFHA